MAEATDSALTTALAPPRRHPARLWTDALAAYSR